MEQSKFIMQRRIIFSFFLCSNQHEAHESRPKDFAVKLSDVFDQYAEANEWIEAHRRHDCSVMVRIKAYTDTVTAICDRLWDRV